MKTLITGATGFLGGALAHRLHSMGWEVTALGRTPEKLKLLEAHGIKTLQADIEDEAAMRNACSDQEIVFHCAAFPSPWGKYDDFYRSNVLGTRNLVQGCAENKVRRLVYVSTPSIYFSYSSRMNVHETDPLPKPISHYAKTKLLAEQEIDKAHEDGLPVISIRPRALFGPGDTVLFPRLIPRLQSGKLPILGDGNNVIDLTYIDNVVDALLLCAESPAETLGKKYNISNDEPVKLWDLIRFLCKDLNIDPPKRKVSQSLAFGLAYMLETASKLSATQPEPMLTRLAVSMMSNSTTLDITAAKTELGYKPRVSVAEGVYRFLKWWKEKNNKEHSLRVVAL
jgi:nucleoside-diphosphate-sugar epimerase